MDTKKDKPMESATLHKNGHGQGGQVGAGPRSTSETVEEGAKDKGVKYLSLPSQNTIESMTVELHAIVKHLGQEFQIVQQIVAEQKEACRHFQTIRRDVEMQINSLLHMHSNFERSAKQADTSDAEFEDLVLIAIARNSKIASIASRMKGLDQQYHKFNQALTTLLSQPAEDVPVERPRDGEPVSSQGSESQRLADLLLEGLSACSRLMVQFTWSSKNQSKDEPGDPPGDQSGGPPGDQPGDQPGDEPGDEPGDQLGDQPGGHQKDSSSTSATQQADGKLTEMGGESTKSCVDILKDIPTASGEVAVMKLEEGEVSKEPAQPNQGRNASKKKQKGKKH